MTRAELLAQLRALQDSGDAEAAHAEADAALLSFIADDEIREAFEEIPRWYA